MTKKKNMREEKVREFEIDSKLREKWNIVLGRHPEANFLQSPEFGAMNALTGAEVIVEDFDGQGWALMIVRDAKRGRYLEIPCGPLIDWQNKNLVQKALLKIIETAKSHECVFIRMRPQLLATDENMKLLEDMGLKKSPMHLAAEHTVMLDLTQSEEEMLAGMRRQTRYEVRRADKLGLRVTWGDSEELYREFHSVQGKTAQRQGFVPPSLDVLMAEREAFGKTARIYVTRTESGEPVAYGLIIGGGREADYYEAASTELNRKQPGAYALLWKAMRDMKEMGYERFNLWGIAPAGQPNHRYAGVTTFKTGFGGEVVEYVPAHDLVVSRVGYMKDYIVEIVRKKRRHL